MIPSDGRFRFPVAVRFRDLDSHGHAHHTLPLIYLEEARAELWRRLTGSAELHAIDYVIAELVVRYHARTHYPETVDVELAVSHVGTKSFAMEFAVRSSEGVTLSSGRVVHIAFDYRNSASKPIEPHLREQLDAWRAVYEKSVAMMAETAPIMPPST